MWLTIRAGMGSFLGRNYQYKIKASTKYTLRFISFMYPSKMIDLVLCTPAPSTWFGFFTNSDTEALYNMMYDVKNWDIISKLSACPVMKEG